MALAFAIFDVSDLAIAHVKDAVGDLGGLRVVRNHQDGLIEFPAGLTKHLQNGIGVFSIQIARRLIGKHNSWASYKRASNSDALLLTP